MSYFADIRKREIISAPGTWFSLLLADIQPVDAAQIAKWRSIVTDLIERHPGIDDLIIAGDLVHRGVYNYIPEPEDTYLFPELRKDLERILPMDRIFVCGGNHDRNYAEAPSGPQSSHSEYLNNWPKQNYATLRGNILTIFMSDMMGFTPGTTTKHAVAWFKRLVAAHQYCIIILVTHHTAPSSGLYNSTNRDYNLGQGGTEIANIISSAGHKIDLWISGHTSAQGGGGLLHADVVSHVKTWDCWHVNVGLHIPSYIDSEHHMSYCTMRLTQGSDHIAIDRWDVETGERSELKSFNFRARNRARLNRALTHDGRYQYNDREGYMAFRQTIADNAAHDYIGGNWVPRVGPDDLLTLISEDRWGTNLVAGQGPAIAFYVPGDVSTNEEEGYQAYGFGGRISALRADAADQNYAADLLMYAATSGQGEDSAVIALRALSTGNVVTTPQELSSSDDLNNLRIDVPGAFVSDYTWNSDIPTNAPGTFCYMRHMQSSFTSAVQIAQRRSSTQQLYIRGYTGGDWTSWRTL